MVFWHRNLHRKKTGDEEMVSDFSEFNKIDMHSHVGVWVGLLVNPFTELTVVPVIELCNL